MDFSIRDGEQIGDVPGSLHWKRVTGGEWLLFVGSWLFCLVLSLVFIETVFVYLSGFALFFITLLFVGIGVHSIKYTEDTAAKAEASSKGGEESSTNEEAIPTGDAPRNQPTEKIRNRARKSTVATVLLGIFIPPAAYVYVGKWGWAVANLFTVNYLFLGVLIVPIHTYVSVKNAREEVNAV